MATKYAALRGKVPEQPIEASPKQVEIAKRQAVYTDRSLLNLTTEYNKLCAVGDDLADQVKDSNLDIEAVERLIQEQLDAQGADSVKMNGFTWSIGAVPYPSVLAMNVAEVEKYFKDNGMAEQLSLSATELASRLKTFVKEEALANELIIEERTVVDEATGVEKIVTDVKSKIPGVRVFLKSSLSRVKSTK